MFVLQCAVKAGRRAHPDNALTLFQRLLGASIAPSSHCSHYVPLPHHLNRSPFSTSANAAAAAVAPDSSTHFSSHNQNKQQQQDNKSMIVLPMPSLSHNMSSGVVSKWLKQPGQPCHQYDVLAEITTDTLVEEAYRLDDFAGSVTLLLESQEDTYLAAVLVPEGQEVPVGTPIAVLCEDEEDVQSVAEAAAQQLSGVEDVYNEQALQQNGLQDLKLFVWQSYLKTSNKEGGSSCGCM